MTARILIVDDVPANTRLLEAKLAAEYYQIGTARDGFEAIAKAKTWQPDLILLDVMMPGMDGYECCRLLKDDAVTLHIPVVMVTALGEPGERLRGLDAGADDFLTKPVEYDTLMTRVRSLVRLKRLLDEWRARGDTARALGLTNDRTVIPSIAGARALIVDDWEQSGQAIQDALTEDGVIPALARNSADAIAMTNAITFDLIAINMTMTGEDPLKLVSALRAADATHETPVLLVAEPGDKDRILRAFELGANDWLVQPIDGNELRARARNQIRRKFYQDRLRSDLGTALEMVLTDPLTGLYNKRYLERHLGGLIETGKGRHLAILMVDVDHFKAVNDAFGHAAGDRALRLIADSLRLNTRVFDSVARYGGEEFVVVMPGTGPEEAIAAAERLRAAVEAIDFSPVPGTRSPLTVSVGVAFTPAETGLPDILLNAADAALYQAKRNGRNRVEIAQTVAAT
nr:PleD family two-component system response regulator [uncultured Rhodopila sp.]